jgi:putative lipase involved disintegration of autophagic bodies
MSLTFMEAHAGFLNSALKLKDRILNSLERCSKANELAHVLFTGHSAGGAFATLLYLKYRVSTMGRSWKSQTLIMS